MLHYQSNQTGRFLRNGMRRAIALSLCITVLSTLPGAAFAQQAARKSSSATPANEQLKSKLARYVAEGKVFKSDKIADFNNPTTEFGAFSGSNGVGYMYEGKSYSLLISFEYVGESGYKICDFILDEKNKLSIAGGSYNECAIYKNGKKNSEGFYSGEQVCDSIVVVKLKTPVSDCMVVYPVLKAWKKDAGGKFIETDVTGLTWYDFCP
ncbi:MAG: hypothetical protein LBP50_02245 [Tannerella sp.]|jgi:hypothetical protein|nr:hypothetical protein [Tannerella sp.]